MRNVVAGFPCAVITVILLVAAEESTMSGNTAEVQPIITVAPPAMAVKMVYPKLVSSHFKTSKFHPGGDGGVLGSWVPPAWGIGRPGAVEVGGCWPP